MQKTQKHTSVEDMPSRIRESIRRHHEEAEKAQARFDHAIENYRIIRKLRPAYATEYAAEVRIALDMWMYHEEQEIAEQERLTHWLELDEREAQITRLIGNEWGIASCI